MNAIRVRTFLAALAIGLLLSVYGSPVRAQAENSCTFENPIHDGRSFEEHLVAGGFDGHGLHPSPSDPVYTRNIFGVDTQGDVYPMFDGHVSYAGADTVGSGGNIVAIEGDGACAGWRMLVSHADDVSHLSVGQIVTTYTWIAREGRAGVAEQYEAHNHISVGYLGNKVEFGLPQYDRYAQHWVNPILLVGKSIDLGNATLAEAPAKAVVAQEPKKESIQVNVDLVKPLVTLVTGGILVVLLAIAGIFVLAVIWRRAAFVLGVLTAFANIMFVVVVIGPPPYELREPQVLAGEETVVSQETQLDESLVDWAQRKGVGVKNLEANLLASSVCWSIARPGFVAAEEEDCRKVDLLLLLGIDNTETLDSDVEWYDPTRPGPMGWEAVEVTAYRRWGNEGGLEQLRIIWQIMMQPEMRTWYPSAIVDVNGNGSYEPQDGDHINVYGSSATAIGRSQGLPTSIVIFADGLIADTDFTFDPWNDELSSALFKAAHLANDYEGVDVWDRRRNAAMGYNPNQAQLDWMLTLNRINELSDIPSQNPILTIVTTTTHIANGEERKLFYVMYSKDIERTPLEQIIEWSTAKRAYHAEKWESSNQEQTRASLLALWAEFESSACNVSWGFAARPCTR